MRGSNIARALGIVLCAVFVFAPCAIAQQTTATQPQVNAFPEGSLALIRVSGLSQLVHGLNEFAGALQDSGMPVPSAGNQIDALLGSQIKNPQLLGVDTEGTGYAVVFPPSMAPKPLAIIIPISNKHLFVTGLCRVLRPTKETPAPGVRTYVEEKIRFDQKAWMKAPPNQRQDLKRFQRVERKNFYYGFTPDYAVMAMDPQLCAKALTWVKDGGAKAREAKMPSMVSVHVAVAPIMKMFEPQIEQKMQQLSAMKLPRQGNAAQIKMLQAEVAAATDMLKQVKECGLGLNIQKEGVDVVWSFDAMEGTDLAQAIARQKPGPIKGFERLPAGALIAAGVHLTDMSALSKTYLAFLKSMMSNIQTNENNATDVYGKMEGPLTEMMNCIGQDAAFAMLQPEGGVGMQMAVVVEVKAGETAALRRSLKGLMDQMTDLYKAMGMPMNVSMQEKVASYKGHDIDLISFDMGEYLKTVPGGPQSQRAMIAMFGAPDKMTEHVAYVRGYQVVAIGKDSGTLIKKLIDLSSGTGDVPSLASDESLQQALSGMPKEANVKGYFSLGGLMRWVLSFAAGVSGAQQNQQVAQMLQSMNFPPGGVSMWMATKGNVINGQLQIPTGQIIAGGRAFMQLQMLGMQMQRQRRRQGGPRRNAR